MKKEFFFHHQDLNHGPLELRASVLPMSYADPFDVMGRGETPCMQYSFARRLSFESK